MVPESEEGTFVRLSEPSPYGTATESVEAYRARIAGQFWVALYRYRDYLPDQSIGMHTFPVAAYDEQAIWTALTQGRYYLEVYRLSGNPDLPVRSDLLVNIYAP